MTLEEKKLWAVEILRRKSLELDRVPHKDDFDEPTRSRIKAFLGPWPRALEVAGLKEARELTKSDKPKKRKKRIAKDNIKRKDVLDNEENQEEIS